MEPQPFFGSKAMTAAPKRPKRAKATANGPSEIAPGVFVGTWDDALAFQGARFCVLDKAPEGLPPAAQHRPIYDQGTDRADPKKLDGLVASMRAARSKGEPVLVFCHQGIYRSPLGGAWYLHRAEGLPLDAAYDRIRA